ncbi:hypothetical protein GOBAR_AA26979 [Gossypium barbadense]|uniref:Reverse transcriptase zinc-binding domain-containing protein n=1 Tax=Gossypium barbadense TaxID=3634 RepID=A0A2P5WRI2_GOSBA|nr:hypothetical protein GOBAR_AA26979 [Gossypium barbadense]
MLDEFVRVCDMVTASGDWNWELLTLVLPVSALHLITAVLPPSKAAGDDRIAWHWFCASKFSVAKKYAHFPRLEGSANPVDWHLVWHCHIPQQVRAFLWAKGASSSSLEVVSMSMGWVRCLWKD